MPKYRRGSGSIYKRGKTWWLSYYRNGERIREPSGTNDRAEARRLLQQRLGQIAEGRYIGPAAERVTFEELAEGLFIDYQVNGKRSLKWVRIKVNKHLIPFFSGKAAHKITTTDVQTYIRSRQEEGASNGEINRELAAMKRAYSLALKAEKITRKPYIPRLAENNVRQGFFEPWEFEAILAHLPDYLRSPITFAYWTGWRLQSEILPLTWQQVDLEACTVRLLPGTTKNGEGRVIFLTPELRALLEAQWQEHLAHYPDCSLVFHRQGERIKDLRGSWERACREAGLSGKIPHDFRRTAVRNMVRAGISEHVAMQMSGHKTRDVFDRYDIVSEGDLRAAARKLSEGVSAQTVTSLVTIAPSEQERPTLTH